MAETKTTTAVATKEIPLTLQGIVARVDVKKRFEEMLGAKANMFLSSLMSLQNANPQLKAAEPWSIVQAAAIAAALDLPINQSLGRAFIIPYGNLAQFQLGAKGFVELAIRTMQYKNIHTTEVYRDEIRRWDALTGEFESMPQETWKLRDKGDFRDIVGYLAHFKLLAGFEKSLYMTVNEIKLHATKYSKSFANPKGIWATNPDAMAKKTVLKLLLSKWGILSVQMQKAMEVDQAVIAKQGVIDTEAISYPDRPEDEPVVSKPTGAEKVINQDQFKLLMAKVDKSGIELDEVSRYVKDTFKKEHFHDLLIEELSKTLKWLEQAPPDTPELPMKGEKP